MFENLDEKLSWHAKSSLSVSFCRSKTLERFSIAFTANILIQSLKENAKRTQLSTNNRTKVWKSWASKNCYDKLILKRVCTEGGKKKILGVETGALKWLVISAISGRCEHLTSQSWELTSCTPLAEKKHILPWLSPWHCTENKMASFRGNRPRRKYPRRKMLWKSIGKFQFFPLKIPP